MLSTLVKVETIGIEPPSRTRTGVAFQAFWAATLAARMTGSSGEVIQAGPP